MGEFAHLQMLETRFGCLLAKRERYGTDVWCLFRYLAKQEHIQNFARSAEMDFQLLSADDPAYQQIANVLSGLTCVKRFNQQYSSYSHEYPVDSVTVSYYDDAENNNVLFTVYSDGTAIVNSQFVKVKAPKGGAEEVYQKLAEIVK